MCLPKISTHGKGLGFGIIGIITSVIGIIGLFVLNPTHIIMISDVFCAVVVCIGLSETFIGITLFEFSKLQAQIENLTKKE
jgi:hypothetical protein